jgi:RNA polymerase sigma-70 factor (ECF subfamily)
VDQLELVKRARGGDHDAFAVLAGAALARLDAAARLIVRDTELARDVVQDAMLKAWRDLPTLREPERFDAWLHRLTMRACIDAARRQRRHVVEVALSSLGDPAVADDTAAVVDRDLLDRVLSRLEPEQRAILVLRYYLDLSLPDAADALGIPLGTAKSRLHRSLIAIRSSVRAGDDPATAASSMGRFA